MKLYPDTIKNPTFEQVCRGINWPSLSSQKQTLLKLRTTSTKKKDKDNLDGIINLIDALQDSAVDVHGVAESQVFPSLNLIRLSGHAGQIKEN